MHYASNFLYTITLALLGKYITEIINAAKDIPIKATKILHLSNYLFKEGNR